jgi:hypothetical protein
MTPTKLINVYIKAKSKKSGLSKRKPISARSSTVLVPKLLAARRRSKTVGPSINRISVRLIQTNIATITADRIFTLDFSPNKGLWPTFGHPLVLVLIH